MRPQTHTHTHQLPLSPACPRLPSVHSREDTQCDPSPPKCLIKLRCATTFQTTCSYPLSLWLNHGLEKKREKDPLKHYGIFSPIRHALGFDQSCANTVLSNRRIDGPLIRLWFDDQAKGCGAWWCSSDPGRSLSGLSDRQAGRQSDMRPSSKQKHQNY